MTSNTPPARFGEGISYDRADGYVVLFGGDNVVQHPLNDTWTFANGNWTNITPAVSPPARYAPSMVYDGQDGYILLFGGDILAGGLGDTWKFAGGVWTNITSLHSPGARWGAAISFDHRDRQVLLFGGAAVGPTGQVGLSDTWRFSNGSWTQLNTTRSPTPRAYAALAFDHKDGYMLLEGGFNVTGHGNFADTWIFVKGSWHVCYCGSPRPSSRSMASMAYDPKDGYLVLFGGENRRGVLGDTWIFLNGAWHAISPSTSPSSRSGAAMTYDGKDGYLVLFGGTTNKLHTSVLNDSWMYAAGNWTQI